MTVRIAERIPPALQAALADTRITKRKNDLIRIAGMPPDRHRQLLEHLEEQGPRPAALDTLLVEIALRNSGLAHRHG